MWAARVAEHPTHHLWGVPKRYLAIINRTRPGDTLIVYVGQQGIDRDTPAFDPPMEFKPLISPSSRQEAGDEGDR